MVRKIGQKRASVRGEVDPTLAPLELALHPELAVPALLLPSLERGRVAREDAHPGVADDVDEQYVSNLEPEMAFGFSGHRRTNVKSLVMRQRQDRHVR